MMVTTKRARSWRRAAGRLRPGGKVRWPGAEVLVGGQQRVAPEQTDQGQVAVQPRPGAPLVVAEPELLLAVLMEPLHRPARVGPADSHRQRAAIQAPGEVPFRLAGLAAQRMFADQPAFGPG